MALIRNIARTFELGYINELPVKGATKIYQGAAVGLEAASGFVRGLVAGDVFQGFAREKADNSGANGAVNVRVQDKGKLVLGIAGAVITDVGKAVYASDDNTFTFIATSNSFVGITRRFEAGGVMLVEFDVAGMKAA